MMVRLLITEWERVLEHYQPYQLKSGHIKQYSIPLYITRRYPRFHLHVKKKHRIWIEVWVHIDWKRHKKYESFNGELVDFIQQIQSL